ncbi:hypothetical protein PROFUN_03590 [Planoprotostelium fungivorum]|uniref:Uncharacterized protein n=1 Tax=Planoprotostelium fungivorum TaxID=1890364 RepID=A0A2P6MSJ0_9EUKA|nr:hypothetical protein PROFUN_03590 [Planoprotostelium fungivorum]
MGMGLTPFGESRAIGIAQGDTALNRIFLGYFAILWSLMARETLTKRLQPGVFKNAKGFH